MQIAILARDFAVRYVVLGYIYVSAGCFVITEFYSNDQNIYIAKEMCVCVCVAIWPA